MIPPKWTLEKVNALEIINIQNGGVVIEMVLIRIVLRWRLFLFGYKK